MKQLLFSLLIMTLPFLTIAQDGTFKAGLIGGFNAAQIDGDLLAGYNKFGFHAGGTVAVQVADKWRTSIEFLYSQKGSRSSADEVINHGFVTRFSLDYVEIPVMINYVDGGFMLNAGLSFGRVVRVREVFIGADLLELEGQYFNKNTGNLLAGLGYFFNDHVGIEVRYSYSPFIMVDYKSSPSFDQGYIGKSLTFRTVYMF